MGLRGERQFEVSGLPVPSTGSTDPTATPTLVGQYAAVQLFVERAVGVQADFEITNANAPAVAEICARLDGLPLAIELAAARIKMFSPEALLRRLEQRLGLTTGGARDLPVRQQTLRDAIAWSYDLLPPERQEVFRRLAVFPGSFGLDAVRAVTSWDHIDDVETLDAMTTLVDHSLLRRELENSGEDNPRFGLLETIREFAFERLAMTEDAARTRQRHALYFLAEVEAAESARLGSNHSAWLSRWDAEHDNLRAALAWAIDRDVEVALRFGAILWRYWHTRTYLSEGRSWLERALTVGSDVRTVARVRALAGYCSFALVFGDLEAMETATTERLALAQELGDQFEESRAFHDAGIIHALADQYDQASAIFAQARDLSRSVGDREGVALATINLSESEQYRGNYSEAVTLGEQALALWTALGERDGMARAVTNLASAVRMTGNHARSVALHQEALMLHRETGNRVWFGSGLCSLAVLAIENGRFEHGVRLLAAGNAILDELTVPLEPAERADVVHCTALARGALGQTAFTDAWEGGRSLGPDQVLAEAFSDTDEIVPKPR